MKVSFGFNEPNTLTREIEKVIDFDVLIKNLEKNNRKYYGIVALPYYLYKASGEQGNNNLYFICRDLLFSNYNLYSKRQLYTFAIHLESLCIMNFESKSRRAEEGMKLYRFMFDKDILSFSDEEHVQLLLFRNIIFMTGLSTIEWTDGFVVKELPRIEPGCRDSMKSLWEAQKCFLLGDFGGVLKHTHKINFDLLFLKMDVKQLYLIAYYELGYFEEARSMTDTFAKYLKQNDEVALLLRQKHLNYIHIYNKLLKLKETGDTEKTEELKKEIHASKQIIKRAWLLEKIEELEK